MNKVLKHGQEENEENNEECGLRNEMEFWKKR